MQQLSAVKLRSPPPCPIKNLLNRNQWQWYTTAATITTSFDTIFLRHEICRNCPLAALLYASFNSFKNHVSPRLLANSNSDSNNNSNAVLITTSQEIPHDIGTDLDDTLDGEIADSRDVNLTANRNCFKIGDVFSIFNLASISSAELFRYFFPGLLLNSQRVVEVSEDNPSPW